MPWCDGCDRFFSPNTLRSDGSCPSCERKVAEPSPGGGGATRSEGVRKDAEKETVTLVPDLPESATDVPKAPWHFKLLVVVTVIYLGWRLVQLLGAIA